MNKRYKITSRFRFTLFITITILCIFTVMSTLIGFNTVSSSAMDQYHQVKIQSGDTLWEIAAEYGPEDADVRRIIHEICDINEISADSLEAGQTIIVPVYE
ncbi:cell division suppressor protein YneA [Ihubacter sp. rT4E-8]|uniref:cell division suppressor protein YneA n=1 Tax=unclassified Ihubacter TaxID=2633299 RepID=UPI00137B03AB